MIEYPSNLSSLTVKHVFRHVELSSEQLAKLCGVSRRQFSYWIKVGLVPPPEKDVLATIERASFIKARLDYGDSLRQAVERAADYYDQYRRTMARLEAMTDEERGQELTAELAELHRQVSRLREALAEPSSLPFALQFLVTVLRNLSLSELLTMLPHSRPTPDLIIRLQQTSGYLRMLLREKGSTECRPSSGS